MNFKHPIFLTAGLLLIGAGCAGTPPAAPAGQQPAVPAATAPAAPAVTGEPAGRTAPASEAPALVPRPVVPAAPSTQPAGQYAVTISNFSFNPPSLTVRAGSRVTWTNQDPVTHSVKTVDGGDLAGISADSVSPDLNQGDTYVLTFTKPGTFDYRCGIHPSMTGSVTVTP